MGRVKMLRLNQTRTILLGCVIVVVTFVFVIEQVYDSCGGRAFTEALCKQFEDGAIDGTLCWDLCRRKTLRLRSCIYDSDGYRLFFHGNYYLKVLESRFKSSPLNLDDVFVKPSVGVDVKEFRQMIKQFVGVKLGEGHHTEVIEYLMDAADVNRDSRVSLAEAKSLWSLLKHNEFFMLTMLHGIQHVPSLGGFCGDMYAVQAVNHTPLYTRPSGGLFGPVSSIFHHWGRLNWNARGKLAVGLLEFVSEIYHHRGNGMVYICDASENAFGYSDNHDLMVINLNALRPRNELALLFENHPCASDKDCRYLNDCVFKCSDERKTCSGNLVWPNLLRVCRLLRDFLRPNVPRVIRAELFLLLDRCNNLNSTSPQAEMDHALISNELRSLLWHYVSDYVS